MWYRKISLISHRNLNLLLLLITVWNPRNFLFCIWLFDDSAAALPRRREAHVCAILSCSSWHLLVVSTLDSLSSSANPHTPQNASIKSVNTHHCSTVEVMPSSFSRPPCAKKIVIFYMPARLVYVQIPKVWTLSVNFDFSLPWLLMQSLKGSFFCC